MAPKKKADNPQPKATTAGPTETEREFFVLEIADLNRKIARLRAGIDGYEQENLRLQEAYEKLDQDRNDVIFFLKKTLTVKNEEINELKEKVKGLEEIREIETKDYKSQIADLEKNFTIMKSQLSAENKLLSGKLNTLEEFRAIRDDLMMKFEKQEQAFKDQELMYKRLVYDAEKKLIVAKDMLKKDMEKRLLQLAQDYQDATETRVAASTHRVLRENIAINHELDFILMGQEKLHSMNEKFKNQAKAAQIARELAEEERDTAIRKSVTQLKVIEQLTASVVAMKKQYARDMKESHDIESCERKLETLESRNKSLSLKVKILEQKLHCKENAQFDTKIEVEKIILENHKLKNIIRDAEYSLQAVFKTEQLIGEPTTEQKGRSLLLNKVAGVLGQYRMPMKTDSGETIISFGATYRQGDLGFVPQKEPSRGKIKRKESGVSRLSSAIEQRSASVTSESRTSAGSLATMPSMTLVPRVEGEEVPEAESIPSFARSNVSEEEEEEAVPAEEDMETMLAKSKLAMQQSVFADLVALSKTSRISQTLEGSRQFSKIGGIGSVTEQMRETSEVALTEEAKEKPEAGAEGSTTEVGGESTIKTEAGAETTIVSEIGPEQESAKGENEEIADDTF